MEVEEGVHGIEKGRWGFPMGEQAPGKGLVGKVAGVLGENRRESLERLHGGAGRGGGKEKGGAVEACVDVG